jgi:hypothetical protein
MKRIILSIIFLSAMTVTVFAQDETEEQDKGFKKENLFTGGSITASFYGGDTRGTILGANPIFGYKLSNWADAGIALNYTYAGARDFFDTKIRQHVFGGGAFARLYPVRFLFLQGQFEHNYIREKDKYSGGFVARFKGDANSLLVGAGIAEGRQRGSNSFFYISLLFDVLNEPNSPYVNKVIDANTGQVIGSNIAPIVRAGVNIALFQGKYNRYENDRENGRKRPRYYSNL